VTLIYYHQVPLLGWAIVAGKLYARSPPYARPWKASAYEDFFKQLSYRIEMSAAGCASSITGVDLPRG
jgi:hypothetical protein